MKKFIALLLVVALTAGISIAGTTAYLQSEDSDVNVMTLGNVKIDQIEQERDENGELVNFTQAKPAFPAVGPIDWANEMITVNGGEYKVFTPELKNVVDKIVTVENTGKSPAYVRTIVAIEAPDYDPNDLIHLNYNDAGVSISAPVPVEIDGVKYVCFAFTYAAPLAAGDITVPSLMQVFLDSKATNEDVAKFGDTWEILVVSQAVQTEGFTDAGTALDTAFGKPSEKVAEWFAGMEAPVTVADMDELSNQFYDGGNILLTKDIVMTTYLFGNSEEADIAIDLNGKRITVESAAGVAMQDTAFVAQDGANIELNGDGVLDMTKSAGKSYCMPFYVSSRGVVTVNGGTYYMSDCKQKYHIYVQNSGKVVINDGTFITSDPGAAIAYCINGFIEINGGFFQNTANPEQALLNMGNNINYANNQKITLRGGTFVNWNPMDSAFARPWTNPDVPALIVLADGYKVVSETQSNGDIWYTVVKAG